MNKYIIALTLFITSFFCAFGDDQYMSMTISAVTREQQKTLRTAFLSMDTTGSTISLFEYNGTTQTVTISYGGPDVAGLRTRLRNLVNSQLGRFPNTDSSISKGDKVTTVSDIPRIPTATPNAGRVEPTPTP